MGCHKQYAVGDVFGMLTVSGDEITHWDAKTGRNRYYYPCRCECGNATVARKDRLGKPNCVSCGCVNKAIFQSYQWKTGEAPDSGNRFQATHGMHGTRLYGIWCGMRDRCQREKHPSFDDYGGRGITVCDEWQTFETFRDWALANGYASHLEIDRIDNDSGYRPDNCRWVTHAVNMSNRRKPKRKAKTIKI